MPNEDEVLKKIDSKLNTLSDDINQIKIDNALLINNGQHCRDTIESEKDKVRNLTAKVISMESVTVEKWIELENRLRNKMLTDNKELTDKIEKQNKYIKQMGYIGAVIGATLAFIFTKVPKVLN